jgi:PAS domain S-box-containing protein
MEAPRGEAAMRNELQGRRVLVVEDVAVLPSTFEDVLVEAGAEVIGPAMTLDDAERLAAEESLSAALLDIRLDGDEIWSVAHHLDNRGVPFVFVTGHFDNQSLPAEWRGRPILIKPARPHAIIETVANLEREARLRFVAERAKVGYWDWDIASGRLEWSSTCRRLFGISEDETLTYERFLAAVHPDDRMRTDQAVKDCLEGSNIDLDIEFRARLPDGAERWIHNKGSASFAANRPVRMAGIALDVSERKRSEEHGRLIMQEMSHRAKNLMAVVQAISWQTTRRPASLEDFERRFTQRLEALGRSHDLLVERHWRGVLLEDLVHTQLEPFLDRAKERVVAHGPALLLMPDATQDLGLALHELATNASKYGALSDPAGKIDILWTVDDGGPSGAPRFLMTWRETGGPVVSPPTHKGFGSTVLTSTLSRSFKGKTRLDYAPEGLIWELGAPMRHLIAELR